MAKIPKKQLRRLNQRAGRGVMPSVHPMTKILFSPNAGSPEESEVEPEAVKRQTGLNKGTRSWINADVRRPWRPWDDAAERHSPSLPQSPPPRAPEARGSDPRHQALISAVTCPPLPRSDRCRVASSATPRPRSAHCTSTKTRLSTGTVVASCQGVTVATNQPDGEHGGLPRSQRMLRMSIPNGDDA